jgi:hypothetical protein
MLEHKLRSTRRRVFAYRIQKLRTRRQWVLVAGRSRALPVGGGPRYPEWFQGDFSALLELLRGDKIRPVVVHEILERSVAKGKLVLVPQAA